jgi:hypothetical protein
LLFPAAGDQPDRDAQYDDAQHGKQYVSGLLGHFLFLLSLCSFYEHFFMVFPLYMKQQAASRKKYVWI